MLVVETVAKVRRAYFVQGKTIKAICRELRLSRKVVRRFCARRRRSFATSVTMNVNLEGSLLFLLAQHDVCAALDNIVGSY